MNQRRFNIALGFLLAVGIAIGAALGFNAWGGGSGVLGGGFLGLLITMALFYSFTILWVLLGSKPRAGEEEEPSTNDEA